jgi:hypothetical protein
MYKTGTTIGAICLSLYMAGVGFAKTIEGSRHRSVHHAHRSERHAHRVGPRHRSEHHAHSVGPRHRSEHHSHNVGPRHHSSTP